MWKYFSANDPKDAAEQIRFSILPPTGTSIELIGEASLGSGRRAIDISLSGERIVFIGNHNGRPHIFVRDLDDFNAKVIPQTEGAYACTLSPDASEVAYFVGNSLRKIKIDGGSPVSLAEVANPTCIVWLTDNTIYFGADEGFTLYKYSQKAELKSNGWWFSTLSRIPDTDYLLICTYYNKIGLYNIKSDSVIDLNLRGTSPMYLTNGSIALMRGSTLLVVPFDITKLEILSEPKEILTGIRLEHLGAGQFSVSRQGTIIYIAGDDTYIGRFVWVDRNGKTEPIAFSKENYGTFKLSPDQSRIAAPIYSTTNDLWVHDISNSKKIRVTDTGRSDYPVWRDNNFTLNPTCRTASQKLKMQMESFGKT